jgi:hypothetical protein
MENRLLPGKCPMLLEGFGADGRFREETVRRVSYGFEAVFHCLG